MNNEIELIILLNGNFAPVRIPRSKIGEFNEMLKSEIKNNTEPRKILYISQTFFMIDSIVGWYFREILQNPTDKIINFMDKKLPNENSGEDWKNG